MQEEKISDLQEQNLVQINSGQSEMSSQKSLHDHQIQELKKRINEIEEASQTHKS